MLHALVVEDARPIAERMVELVTIPGKVEVIGTAPTEDDAREACDRYRIDIAVIDLQLAQGTGFGVIRKLRERGRPPTCVIVVTNHAVPALKVAAFEAGADYFLDKAKDFTTLRRIVAELVAQVAA